MGDLLNLNRFRKRKERESAKDRADVNAAKHGRTRAERDLTRARRDLEDDRLDGAQLGDDPERRQEAAEPPGASEDRGPSGEDEPDPEPL